jgi:hypothetical protein
MNNNNLNIKIVNLSVRLCGFTVDISKDFLKELDLEYGSTYSFIVSYGKPLTFKAVPYDPFKLTMEDIKVKDRCVPIKSHIFYNSNIPLSESSRNGKIYAYGKDGVLKYDELLHTCIWGLVSRSDIVKGILENRTYRVSDNNTSFFIDDDENVPTFRTPNVPGYDNMDMSIACCKITKGDLSNEKPNILLIN